MRKFLRRFHALIHHRRLHQQLEEEMAAHRAMMPAGRRQHFGNTLRLQEQAADQWGFAWLDQFRQDLAYGFRSLRRGPGFAFTAIAVLSLGIGVNLAELHMFNAFLHRLNVRDVDSLCRFYRITPARTDGGFSIPEIEFYRRNNTALSAVIAETDARGVYDARDTIDLRCSLVSGNFFGELGIAPLYGRLLNEQDDQPGAPPVAVLGYTYWQSRFGGDPAIVMKTIRLNDKPVQVVGIAPAEFAGLARQPVPLWMPLSQDPYLAGDGRMLADYAITQTAMFGRLKTGISLEAAQSEFRSLTAELHRQQPSYFDRREWLKAQPPELPPNSSPAAVLLLTTCILLVLLVLLSACANLGNMLLARGLARHREIEIRLAIGAGRWRVIRQLMTESLLLAGLASIAALFVGRLAVQMMLRIFDVPYIRIVTDWRIVLGSAALGLGATLAFGLAPALQTVKRGPKATRARKALVGIQVAASCVLLILSSVFTRSIQQSFHTEVPFDYSGMALVDPAFYLHNYTPSQARQSALEIAARVQQVPGIEAATIATIPPLQRSSVERSSGQQLYLNEVDPSYFTMMRLPLVQGRIFGPADQDAVVISQSAARKLWPNESSLGKALLIAQRSRTVTGIVKDSGVNLMSYPDSVEAYLPIGGQSVVFVTIMVRAAGNIAPMSSALRSAATTPGIVPQVFTFQGIVDQRLDSMRKMVKIVGSLAAIASLIAMIGIFGLLAFTVAQRTREIGVRMALGARGFDILRIVLGQYTLPFAIGAASGLALAAATARIVRSILQGFAPFDPLSFAAGLLLFAAVALAASIAPARRALRIDPASALRYE